MASRGTRGPSPQTETFHRPTGRAENRQEKNIKSESEGGRERGAKEVKEGERKRGREREGECLHHERNRNDAPLGSISEPLHTMAASQTSKCGNNAKPSQLTVAGRLRLLRKTHLS